MRFFSKITFLCNLCFLAAVVLRMVETNKRAHGNMDRVIALPGLQNTLVILGYGAILINMVFCFACIILLLIKEIQILPRWIVVTNFIFLILEVLYFLNLI